MNRLFVMRLALAGGLLVSSGLQAQAGPQPAVFKNQNRVPVEGAKPFRILKVVPEYAKRAIPKGGKSKFYGALELKTAHQPQAVLRIHFYEWRLKETAEHESKGCCAIDIYLQRNRHDSFHRVSSIACDMGDIRKSYQLPILFVNFLWLDPKTKTIPMIRFCNQATEGFYGPFGQNLFLTFTAGFNQAPAIQSIENSSNHIDFIDWFFDDRDTQGNRRFIQLIDPLGVDAEGDKYIFWNWNTATNAFEAENNSA